MPAATQSMTSVANLLSPLPPEDIDLYRQLLMLFDDKTTDEVWSDKLTPTQVTIIDIIASRLYPRTQLILPTQYGKSLCVAMGILLRISNYKEKWAIVAPSEEKARIIMDYIIDLIFSDKHFHGQLDYEGSKERLKQERSKSRITFRQGGEVRVYSGNASNTRQTKSALMGFGAANIILDEAGQISDELYSTVKRMVGGSEGTKDGTFLLEIGNPVHRNHFHRTWFGERYMKIYVNDEMALAEGRYTQDFLEEMKLEAGYDWMYRCLFPDADEVLPNGYRRLVSDLVVDDALIDNPTLTFKTDGNGVTLHNKYGFPIVDDLPMLGIDAAGTGKNLAKFVIRLPKHGIAMVVATSNSDDLEVLADIAEEKIREWDVQDFRTVVDAGGVGHGLPAILKRRGYLVKAILFGEKEVRHNDEVIFKVPRTFLNIRAWMYWESRNWLREGGKLVRDVGFLELKMINYRQNSSLKTQIEPKEEMLKRLSAEGVKVESPDTADGFVLTFVDTSGIVEEDDIIVD